MARSVPQIPIRSSNAPEYPLHSAIEAADLLARFLLDAARNTLVLTGAGVSVDSGIRAYRGPQGVRHHHAYLTYLLSSGAVIHHQKDLQANLLSRVRLRYVTAIAG